MEIITGHVNSDFDCLAAMIGAKKIYPQATLVLHGTLADNVRDYLKNEWDNLYQFAAIKDIDLEKVTRIIIVDTRQENRIDKLAECLQNPGIDIHIYDHHQASETDIKGHYEVVLPVASCVTIFVQIFQEKNISLTPKEATLMALGLYEDTGYFLHSNIGPEDLQAGAWLLKYKPNLDTVRHFLAHDLTPSQVEMLNELHKNGANYTINATRVTITSLVLPEFVNGFADLVRRLMLMDNLDVLFGLIMMEDKLYIIGRSRIPEVNVGAILREFGGGGHAAAASATVKDLTIFEAEEKLVRHLHNHIVPGRIAGEIMSTPPISVPPETSIKQAHDAVVRYNINALPIVDKEGLVQGIVSRQTVEKAIFHHLENTEVGDYMENNIAILSPAATLAEIQKIIVDLHQRIIPIVEKKKLVGVITRTDLLNLLINDTHIPKNLLREDENPSLAKGRNMAHLMSEVLGKETLLLLKQIGEIGEKLNLKVYVVGGFVRDLLLRTKNLDIDVVVEGDGIYFARKMAEELGAKIKVHKKFNSGTVTLPDGVEIDVTSARLEYYEEPAALPMVEFSSLKLDLYRRDFTINAMAIALNPDKFGKIIDYFQGQNDLKKKRLRVLHNLSFVEDPTRVFRAIRFENKLEFKISKHSEKLIKNAVRMNMFARLSTPRIWKELKYILLSDNPLSPLKRMEELKLLVYIWPNMNPPFKIDRQISHDITQARQAISWFKMLYTGKTCRYWAVYLLTIMKKYSWQELEEFCNRFKFESKSKTMLLAQKKLAEKTGRAMGKKTEIKNSELYNLLEKLSFEGLLYLMAISRQDKVKEKISLYVTKLQDMKPMIGGADLQDMGFKPGKIYQTIIKSVLEAQLDDKIKNRTEAFEFVQKQFS